MQIVRGVRLGSSWLQGRLVGWWLVNGVLLRRRESPMACVVDEVRDAGSMSLR